MFAVILGKSLLPQSYPDAESARRAANGMLLSRSAERRAEVVPLVPGRIGGIGPAVAMARRAKRGGPIRWSEVRPLEDNS